MKSKEDSQTPLPPSSQPILKLSVKGLGHVPAIKNSMFAIVKKKNREWKKRCVQNFVFQSISIIPTNEQGTLTPQSLHSLTALLPLDDSWKDIPEHSVRCVKVPKGEEGAEILIERL